VKRVLIANRGEIAVRIMRTCRVMGIETVAVCSEVDKDALHTHLADEVVQIGPAAAVESYLVIEKLIEAAKAASADAVHPGYGFLSENASFAQAVVDAGLIWVGPEPATIKVMGDKVAARALMEEAGVPVVPGVQELGAKAKDWHAAAKRLGYPLMVKAAHGGGGKGMRVVADASELEAALDAARREAAGAFGDSTVYLEKYLSKPRHVEFQVFGDPQGQVIHLMERECSIQRRHQKILEETPAPGLDEGLRTRMGEAAVAAAKAVNYVGAGTVEFMLLETGEFYFLEMNTRLQVEHPITEARLGVDLVAAQLLVADGQALPWTQEELVPRGHAIEARLYAEDPAAGFLPATGTLVRYRPPEAPWVRHDSGVVEGDEVSPHYDPMLAKLTVWGATRQEAVDRLAQALQDWQIHGVVTNCDFLSALVGHPEFIAGKVHTGFIQTHYGDGWCPDPLSLLDAAVALAVADTLATKDGTESAQGPVRGDRFSPWRHLGAWRLGP
jgi:acetyl-CoA carboxylase biotin carboxylase subunit